MSELPDDPRVRAGGMTATTDHPEIHDASAPPCRPPRAATRAPAARGAGLALVLAIAGCARTGAARVLNPAVPRCETSLRDAFALMLVGQGEHEDVAEKVAKSGAEALADVDLGAKPFLLRSPSGIAYAFYFEDEGERCLLHLVAMQGGSLQVSDTLTFLATRPLPGCRCEQ